VRVTASRPLTIGIDARAAVEVPAGRGRVVRELLRALAARAADPHHYILYARQPWRDADLDERFAWRTIAARDPWWHLLAARAASRECDVFLSSNSYLTVWFLRIPAVLIVYDLATFEPTMRPNRRSMVIERLTLGPAVRRSAALLAISHATADALGMHFPAAVPRTVVAHLGALPMHAADLNAAEATALPSPGFVLAVGTLEPRKNLPRLVEAYRTLDADLQTRHPLVVVGALGWETGQTLTALRSLGDRCTMLGFVSDAALAELYRRCAVFCYPSLGEGFGLPVLEAMAAGAPVITSNVSSLPEVGGSAAEYVDPHDVASMATALRRVLCDESRRAQLSRAGLERAGEFSWASFAERTLEVLQEASSRS
jgi:glycosyltransferase involved in cell wall biosynthesis